MLPTATDHCLLVTEPVEVLPTVQSRKYVKFVTMNLKAKKIEIQKLEKKFKAAMPKIRKEIDVYEKALKAGRLKQAPTAAPQFDLG